MESLFGFALAGFALVGSPGPATLSLAATGAAFGFRSGVAYFAGIWVGMILVMALTASGVTGLLLALPGAAPVVTVLAVGYIAYLAYRIATAPPIGNDAGERASPSFGGGVFLALVNPKAYAAMAALFSGFVLIEARPALDGLAKAAVLLTLILAVNSCWLFAGSALTRMFRDPRASRIVNVAFAVVLVASVAFAVLL